VGEELSFLNDFFLRVDRRWSFMHCQAKSGTMSNPLAIARARYQPKTPACLSPEAVLTSKPGPTGFEEEIRPLFPNTFDQSPAILTIPSQAPKNRPLHVGVVFSGGPAPGGHNVIAGLFDALHQIDSGSRLTGFLNGPAGLIENKAREIDRATIDEYRNAGGFDLIGSGRTKLVGDEVYRKVLSTARSQELDGIVVVGGDDSNTNACLLAEFALSEGADLCVNGIPKTIDGDLRGGAIETSFGFDTACKIYSELIGNIQRDAMSSRKYWHFIKLMGRSASHIALECALQTHPNMTLISEEVLKSQQTIYELVDHIADIICYRGNQGENFGTILIPEGIIEFVPEMRALVLELNDLLAEQAHRISALDTLPHKREYVYGLLSPASAGLYRRLPREIANQLILDRDPHGNVQVAKVDTQRLFLELVDARLNQMKARGIYSGTFSSQGHYLGYEGRCAPPTNFDADYTYTLGYTVALAIRDGLTGMIACVQGLHKSPTEWVPGAVPLSHMMHLERRHGQSVPVIRKALVDLEGPVFKQFASERDQWALNSAYLYPGPIQYFGPEEISDATTHTLALEAADRA